MVSAAASNPLVAYIERLRATAPQYDWQPSVEAPSGIERRLQPCAAPELPKPAGTLDEARALIRKTILDYLELEVPDHMLLIRAMPGTGKTTAAVAVVDDLAEAGLRVAYSGPRHDFFLDVIAKSRTPEQWYEWQPRQTEDVEKGKLRTCIYPEQINDWLNKGYQAMDFCAGVCGWEYIKSGCAYHRQKARQERVMYIQHQHVTLGHPMSFDILIGDENPAGAFLHEWKVPARWICPPAMDPTQPLTEMLHILSALAQAAPRPLQGVELLEALGGAQAVTEACELFEVPVEALAAGSIHYPEQVATTPYFHLPRLAQLLMREAAQQGHGPQRLIAGSGHLTLLLRQRPDWKQLPSHVIWLDATGQADVYERLFERRVAAVDARPRLQGKIYQMVDRANGKSAIQPNALERKRMKIQGETGHAQQSKLLIERIIEQYEYQQPSLITFKDFDAGMEIKQGHFYAARGTNEHEDADAIFILGAPQANIYDLVKMAKMIFFERETAFAPTWCTRLQPYAYIAEDGQGRAYPVSGFWRDPDLQRVLEMIREDEIVHAAHRGRPVNHPVDIWLLTNIPIWGLPPDRLLTMREVLDAPAGVNIWKWQKVQELMQKQDMITITDLVGLGLHYETGRQYLDIIAALPGWEPSATKSQRGKPTLIARRMA